jgi:hypothetical protein
MANSGGEDDDWEEGFGDEEERGESDDDVLEVEISGSRGSVKLRCENRPDNRPASRETGLEMPCYPASDLLWVQITRNYANRLRFSGLPCPQSPCHTVIDPVFKEIVHSRKKVPTSGVRRLQASVVVTRQST